MSDDNGGSGIEPVAGNDDRTGGGTLDGVHRTLSTLGMRIDALVTSTTSYRSAVTDRLSEYADLVTKLTRAQATDLEEYRHATERTMGELRRGLGTSEETLERVASRIDAMLADADSTDDQSRRMLAEVRSILDAQESLGRFLTEALDQFGDQVTERLGVSETATLGQFEAVQAALASLQSGDGAMGEVTATLDARLAPIATSLETIADAIDDRLTPVASSLDAVAATIDERLAPMASTLDGLRDVPAQMLDVASGEVLAALWDEVRGMREAIAAGAPDEFRAEVAGLADAVRTLLDGAEVIDDLDDLEQVAVDADDAQSTIGEVLAEMVRLRTDLTEGLVIDTDGPAEADVLDDLRADMALVAERVQQIAAIQADAVAARNAQEAEAASESPAQDDLRAEVAELNGSLRQLLDQAEVVEMGDDVGNAGDGSGTTLGQIQASLDELIQRANVAADTTDSPWAPGSGTDAVLGTVADVEARLASLATETGAIGVGVRDVISRLDGGTGFGGGGASSASALGDQVAAMRDQLSVDLDALRQLVAELPHRIEGSLPTAGAYATIDPDTVDVLRAEIRIANASPDDLVESLRSELVALRRRIKLRAEGEVLTDAQLGLIAEAVAERLGR